MNENTEEEFPEVMANDGYKLIVDETRVCRPQVVWWDETLGTEAAFWVDDDLTLCAKGMGYIIRVLSEIDQ